MRERREHVGAALVAGRQAPAGHPTRPERAFNLPTVAAQPLAHRAVAVVAWLLAAPAGALGSGLRAVHRLRAGRVRARVYQPARTSQPQRCRSSVARRTLDRDLVACGSVSSCPCRCRTGPGQVPTWPQVRAFGQHAEAVGLHSLWVCDHLLAGPPDDRAAGIHEGWTILAALAASTSRVELASWSRAPHFGTRRCWRSWPRRPPRSAAAGASLGLGRAGTTWSTPRSATRPTTAWAGSRRPSPSSARCWVGSG
jgi:hypothetical protein